MSLLLVGGAMLLGLLLYVVRVLVADEVRGRLQRQHAARLESIIASLPEDVQERWADEWRAELAGVSSMPLTAGRFVHGIRRTVGDLVAESVFDAQRTVRTRRPITRQGEEIDVLIEELGLGVRLYNRLKRAGINRVSDIASKSEVELDAIPGFTRDSTDELIATLKVRGFSPGQD